MFNKLAKLWMQFRRNEDGVTLVEYGVAVAVAVGVGAFAVTYLVPQIEDAMTAAGDVMPDPAAAPAP